MRPFSLSSVSTMLTFTTVSACDLCGLHDIPTFGSEPDGVSVGIFEQWTHFATLRDDGDKITNDTNQHMDSSVTQVQVGYRINERFALRGVLPYISRSFRRPEGFEIDEGTEAGIGDASLVVDLSAWHSGEDDHSASFNLLAALKMPTGSSDRLAEEANEVEVPGAPESGIHGHDLALGSGSWDVVVGASATGHWGHWFSTADLQYAIRTKSDHQYQYANDLTWNIGPGYFLIQQDELRIGVQLLASGEYKGKDTFADTAADDTAMTSVALGPNVTLAWRQLNSALGFDIPVAQENSAVQIVPDWRLRGGAGWAF